MADDSAPPAARGVTRLRSSPWVAAALYAAYAWLSGWGIGGLGDTDPYRHLRYADELWRSGFALRGHPFLPLTALAQDGVDLWWGFHWLLVPFTPFGVLWGARLAGIAIAAALGATLAAVLKRAGQQAPVVFAVLPLFLSPEFAYRDHLARPSHLTVIFVLVNLAAGAGLLRRGHVLWASLLHAWLHMSSPLSPFFAAVGELGGWLGQRRGGASHERRAGVGVVTAWSVGACVVGYVLRPDAQAYLATAARISLLALTGDGGARLPHTAPELLALSPARWLMELWPSLALLAAALWGSRQRSPDSSAGARWALGLAAGIGLLLASRSLRFVDYAVPLAAFCAGALWPPGWPRFSPRARAAVALALVLAAGWRARASVLRGWATGNRYIDPPATFAEFGRLVRAHVPSGTLLFTDDLFLTAVLYAELPEYAYPNAYDPAVLYSQSQPLFWRWHHAVVDATLCDERACPQEKPQAASVATALHSFETGWAVTSYPPGIFSMQSVMAQSGLFELVGHVPGPVTGLSLWRLRVSPSN